MYEYLQRKFINVYYFIKRSRARTHTHTQRDKWWCEYAWGGVVECQTTGDGPYYVSYRMINHKWTFTVLPLVGRILLYSTGNRKLVFYTPVCVCVLFAKRLQCAPRHGSGGEHRRQFNSIIKSAFTITACSANQQTALAMITSYRHAISAHVTSKAVRRKR